MTKTLPKLGLALLATSLLAACGLTGELERPDPIFSEPPPQEDQEPVDTVIEPEEEPEPEGPFFNDLGGEIPEAAPADDVDEDGLGEVGPN